MNALLKPSMMNLLVLLGAACIPSGAAPPTQGAGLHPYRVSGGGVALYETHSGRSVSIPMQSAGEEVVRIGTPVVAPQSGLIAAAVITRAVSGQQYCSIRVVDRKASMRWDALSMTSDGTDLLVVGLAWSDGGDKLAFILKPDRLPEEQRDLRWNCTPCLSGRFGEKKVQVHGKLHGHTVSILDLVRNRVVMKPMADAFEPVTTPLPIGHLYSDDCSGTWSPDGTKIIWSLDSRIFVTHVPGLKLSAIDGLSAEKAVWTGSRELLAGIEPEHESYSRDPSGRLVTHLSRPQVVIFDLQGVVHRRVSLGEDYGVSDFGWLRGESRAIYACTNSGSKRGRREVRLLVSLDFETSVRSVLHEI